MGQILHGSATTTHAIRAAIQRSKAPLKELAAQYGLNQKTVAKWRKRAFVHDAAMGPKAPHSTVLSAEEEAIVVAFRKHTLLPLDDCLYALQATLPHLPAHHKSWDGLRCPTIALLNIKNIVPLKQVGVSQISLQIPITQLRVSERMRLGGVLLGLDHHPA